MDVIDLLKSRIPTGTPRGKVRAIELTLEALASLRTGVATEMRKDQYTDKGRAPLLEFHAKAAGNAIMRARRQLAYQAGKLAAEHEAIKSRAIGPTKETDAEWRAWLRSMPAGERVAKVLQDPEARGAALRNPALANVSTDIVEKAWDVALQNPDSVQALAGREDADEAQTLLDQSAQMIAQELMKVNFIPEGSGARRLQSPVELENFLSGLPVPEGYQAQLEQVIIDQAETV